jgi:hypothetical protein
MTVPEYEAMLKSCTPYELLMLKVLQKIEAHLDEIAKVGRD